MPDQHISEQRLCEILKAIREIRVLAIGDISINIQWRADMRLSALSSDAPHFPLPIVDERVSLGAGGNVAAVMRALEPESVAFIGLVGEDWRGALARRSLDTLNVDTRALYTAAGFSTFACCKPVRRGISDAICEDPRLDFVNVSPPSQEAEESVVAALMGAAGSFDAIIVSDQFANGCITQRIREALSKMGQAGEHVFVDSSENTGQYRHVVVKPNENEAERVLGAHFFSEPAMPSQSAPFAQKPAIPGRRHPSAYLRAADVLARRCAGKAIITLGADGSVFSDGARHEYNIPWRVDGSVSVEGVGDMFIAAYACALAANALNGEAADFASLCSAMAISRTGEAGVVAPDEIIDAYRSYKYVDDLQLSKH